MLTKLLHTRYRVNDMEKTVAFYRDVLGLELTHRGRSGRGSELAFFKAPESEEQIEICAFAESGPVTVCNDLMHLAFLVDDLDKLGERLKQHGWKFSEGPHGTKGKGRMAFVDAPEGYEIELIESQGG